MKPFTFYTVAMSRKQIVRWALHEAGADYDQVVFDWDNRPAALAQLYPMNKVPTLVHYAGGRDHVVTECAAICHYLAEALPGADLLPRNDEKADYFRWMFFAAGPLEQAFMAQSMGWKVPDGKASTAGFGSQALTVDALGEWLGSRDYICGARFTMADVYLCSQFIWGLRFGTIEDRPAFRGYVDRCTARPHYREGLAIDLALIKAAAARA